MTPRLELLLQLKEYHAAYDALARKDISDELDNLQKVIAESKLVLEQVTQGHGIEKVKAEADAYCEARKKEAEQLTIKANEFKNALLDVEKGLLIREEDLKLEEESLQRRVKEFEKLVKEKEKELSSRHASLSPKEEELLRKEEELIRREKEHADNHAELQRKLEVVKSLGV